MTVVGLDEGVEGYLVDRAGEGVRLTGVGGLLPELVKAVLERGLAAELTDQLGYKWGDPAGRGRPNSRHGSTRRRWRPRSAVMVLGNGTEKQSRPVVS